MSKFTHRGIVRNRMGNRTVLLRETRCFWVSQEGMKYSKAKDGLITSSDAWNISRLDLSTIKVKEQPHD